MTAFPRGRVARRAAREKLLDQVVVHFLKLAARSGEFWLLIGREPRQYLIELAQSFLHRNLQLFEAGIVLHGVDFLRVQAFNARACVVAILIEYLLGLRQISVIHVFSYFFELIRAQPLHQFRPLDRVRLAIETRLKFRSLILLLGACNSQEKC